MPSSFHNHFWGRERSARCDSYFGFFVQPQQFETIPPQAVPFILTLLAFRMGLHKFNFRFRPLCHRFCKNQFNLLFLFLRTRTRSVVFATFLYHCSFQHFDFLLRAFFWRFGFNGFDQLPFCMTAIARHGIFAAATIIVWQLFGFDKITNRRNILCAIILHGTDHCRLSNGRSCDSSRRALVPRISL